MVKVKQRATPTNSPIMTIGDFSIDAKEKTLNVPHLPDNGFGVNPDAMLTDDEDTEEIETSDIERVVAELGNDLEPGAFISVMRTDPTGKQVDSHCMKTGVSDFSIDKLRQQFGGGTYRIRGYAPKEGRRGASLFMNKTITVEEPRPGTVAPVVPVSGQSEIAQLIAAMQFQQQKFQETLLEALKPKPDEGNHMIAALNQIATIKEILMPQQVAPPQDMFSQIEKFFALKKLFTDEGGTQLTTDSPFVAMGMKLMDKLGDMQKTQQGNPAPDITTDMPRPYQVPGIIPTPSPVPLAQDNAMENQAAINMIVSAAQTNGNVEQWANLMYDELPDDFFNMMVGDPNWFTHVSTLDPRIKDYQAWFTAVRDQLIVKYQQENLTPHSSRVDNGASPMPLVDDANSKTT